MALPYNVAHGTLVCFCTRLISTACNVPFILCWIQPLVAGTTQTKVHEINLFPRPDLLALLVPKQQHVRGALINLDTRKTNKKRRGGTIGDNGEAGNDRIKQLPNAGDLPHFCQINGAGKRPNKNKFSY